MNPTVYVETTVVSYLTAWPSRDIIRAAQQRTTREWWDTQRNRFTLVTSELVLLEAGAGDAIAAAAERAAALADVPILQVTEAATAVANARLTAGAVPPTAARDALHVGICAANGIDYLLTWNFRHLANAELRGRIEETCEAEGYRPPVICAPDALFASMP